ncbi:DUF2892 domain-containing protein [Bacillus sp. T3]|uniref:YgaP family membrane protein n=1 Tax=Bacillus sp. T3 TaxID=467262 RepID=UPI0029818D4A|nr:DUF2892 domain-containing protein [Bacillus sp. T3]
MKVTPNIGIVNALIRMTIGFTLLAWTTAKMVKRPWRDSYLFVTILSAMKIAEGMVRYCPMTALFEKLGEMEENHRGTQDLAQEDETLFPYNPT